MSTGPTVKAIKGGKIDETPGVKHITLRGIQYTITEIDLPDYDKAMESAQDKDGNVPFGKLLRAMVLKCVKPLPKDGPLKFPVYRTLEGIVNDMHFQDLPDEAAQSDDEAGDAADDPETTPPNA